MYKFRAYAFLTIVVFIVAYTFYLCGISNKRKYKGMGKPQSISDVLEVLNV